MYKHRHSILTERERERERENRAHFTGAHNAMTGSSVGGMQCYCYHWVRHTNCWVHSQQIVHITLYRDREWGTVLLHGLLSITCK